MGGREKQVQINTVFNCLAALILAAMAAAQPGGARQDSALALAPTRTPTRTTIPIRTSTTIRTPTSTRTPIRTPTPSSLTGSSLIKVNNGEIIQEMGVFGSGGGPSQLYEENCTFPPPAKPALDENRHTRELMLPVYLLTCGWQPGEKVQITVRDPLGKTTTQTALAGQNYEFAGKTEVWLIYQPPFGAPPGKYTFTFQGRSTRLETSEIYSQPSGPRLYVLSPDPFNPVDLPFESHHRLMLYKFASGEKIRLFAYLGNGQRNRFYGYKDYIVGKDGSLQIDANVSGLSEENKMTYFAVGPKSGTVFILPGELTATLYAYPGTDIYCPGAKPSRLSQSRSLARVARVDGTNLRIREKPGFSNKVVSEVAEGEELRLTNSVKCVDGTFWWQVNLPENYSKLGWVAEVYRGKYMIEPGEY